MVVYQVYLPRTQRNRASHADRQTGPDAQETQELTLTAYGGGYV